VTTLYGWEARDVDVDQEWTPVRASNTMWDAANVAEAFAERAFGRDGDCLSSFTIEVRDNEGVVTRWEVDVESTPTFRAYPVKAPQ